MHCVYSSSVVLWYEILPGHDDVDLTRYPGSSPLIDTMKFVKMCQNPQNSAIIRAEIAAIEGKYGAFGTMDPLIPDEPCPFVQHLLYIARSELRGPAHNLSATNTNPLEGGM